MGVCIVQEEEIIKKGETLKVFKTSTKKISSLQRACRQTGNGDHVVLSGELSLKNYVTTERKSIPKKEVKAHRHGVVFKSPYGEKKYRMNLNHQVLLYEGEVEAWDIFDNTLIVMPWKQNNSYQGTCFMVKKGLRGVTKKFRYYRPFDGWLPHRLGIIFISGKQAHICPFKSLRREYPYDSLRCKLAKNLFRWEQKSPVWCRTLRISKAANWLAKFLEGYKPEYSW